MNIAEALQLKFPKANFMKDIQLSDEGNGVFIREWNLADIPKPTDADIEQWKIELDLPFRIQHVQQVRASQYPTWQSQLDMQYHDSCNGTKTWEAAIKAVKDANPKPTE